MTRIVIDASVAIGLMTPSQVTAGIQTFAATMAEATLLAPAIFPVELRHALIKLERRGLVGSHVADRDLPQLERLIEIDGGAASLDQPRILALARQARLGFFDALYVDLAMQRRADLATRDLAVRDAAIRIGIPLRDLS